MPSIPHVTAPFKAAVHNVLHVQVMQEAQVTEDAARENVGVVVGETDVPRPPASRPMHPGNGLECVPCVRSVRVL